MTDTRTVKVSRISELQSAFKRANEFFYRGKPDERKFVIQASGDAEAAMTRIADAKAMHTAVSAVGGGGTGLSVFTAVSFATAPFLGPFCAIAGTIAGALAGTQVGSISEGSNYHEVNKKYGKELVDEARGFKREGGGVYSRTVNTRPTPDYGPGHG